MKIEFELSQDQANAIATFADEFRLTLPEALLTLATMQMNSNMDEADTRAFVRDAIEAVDESEWESSDMKGRLLGWIEVSKGPFRAFLRTSACGALITNIASSSKPEKEVAHA